MRTRGLCLPAAPLVGNEGTQRMTSAAKDFGQLLPVPLLQEWNAALLGVCVETLLPNLLMEVTSDGRSLFCVF